MNSMDNPDWLYPHLTAQAALENKPTVVGIKVRLGQHIQDERDLECLKLALEAAEASHLPLMAHIDTPHSPLPEILRMMRKGDVLTHIYNSHLHGILDENGKILPEAREARERGVHFDVGHGNALLSFDVAEKCLQQDFLPDSISTDLTDKNVNGPVYDLPTVISQMLAIGMDLDGVIERVTVKPAQAFDFGAQLGTLRAGNEADIAIFEIHDGNFEFIDGAHQKRTGHEKLVNKAVVRRGQLFVNVI
jgi:dihydroorotase